jgi:hypothetical protein
MDNVVAAFDGIVESTGGTHIFHYRVLELALVLWEL